MRQQQYPWLASAALVAVLVATLPPFSDSTRIFAHPVALLYIVTAIAVVLPLARRWCGIVPAISATILGGAAVLLPLGEFQQARAGYWLLLFSAWLQAWNCAEALSRDAKWSGLAQFAVPLLFGASLLLLWEAITRGGNVSAVLLPAPSQIGVRIVEEASVLLDDFRQTVLKAVLIGYVIGCVSGAAVAIFADRMPFLRRGLLPLGNFVSALPIVGIAPIMVMWFGFDWQSKAAVVVVMTFFPMLINTVAGLHDHSAVQRDLMSTYAATYRQRLLKLSLPAALPFIFNALKINSTLALIGAIVAEFFGTPIVGMGFRISTEVGRMNLDMVWAEIAVAALTGTAFYGIIAMLEGRLAFWHPSIRHGKN